MKKIILLTILAIGCSSKKQVKIFQSPGDTRSKTLLYLDDETYLLTDRTDDKTYGYSDSNPINVGGIKDKTGPVNERRFLNALLGPNGEEIRYKRAGSCCAFQTPNGMIENMGMLDRYLIVKEGSTDTIALYLNMYDSGDLKVPFGFSPRKY